MDTQCKICNRYYVEDDFIDICDSCLTDLEYTMEKAEATVKRLKILRKINIDSLFKPVTI